MTKSKKQNYIILCIFAFMLCLAYFLPYSIRGHDTAFHILRIEYFIEAIKNGVFFPKVYPAAYDGYGYSTSLFYCDFFLYIPIALVLLGMNVLTAYKIYNALVIFATVFSAYYCFEKLTKNENAALIGSFVYAGSAYFAVDIFIRNALGESQAFVFLPFVLYGIYEVVLGDSKNIKPLVIGFAGLVLSHNLSLIITSIFFAIFLILNIAKILKEPQRIFNIAKAVVVVVLLTAFFLLPFAEQMLTEKFLSGYHARIWHPYTVTIRVRNLFWGENLSGDPYFAPSLGILMFVALLICLYYFVKKPDSTLSFFSKMCLLGGCFAMFMSTSLFPWAKFDPRFNIIQFPSRFHMFSTLFLSAALTFSLAVYKKEINKYLVILVAVLGVVQFNYTVYKGVQVFKNDQTLNRTIVDTSNFEMWDENYFHADHNRTIWREERAEHIDTATGVRGDVDIDFTRDYAHRYIKFDNNTCDNSIEIAAIYYRGYTATDVNTGEKLPLTHSANGWIEVDIGDARSGEFVVEYTGTTVQKISPFVTLAFCAYMMILYHKKLRNTHV